MNLKELEYLQPNSILDCGANVGAWSKKAKEVWPNATIVMVEANPECEPALQETGFPYDIAVVSDDFKEVIFYQRKCGGTSTGDSIYREDTPWYDDENLVSTQRFAVPLDGMCKGHTFDLVKLDLQGGEIDALKGGKDLFTRTKAIIMEVPVDGVKPYNIGAPTRSEVMEYMQSIGFVNVKILEDIIHPLERMVIQQDILFTR